MMSSVIPFQSPDPADAGLNSLAQVTIKRSITVKSMVTDAFRELATQEMAQEKALLQEQLQHLEQQFQHNLSQLQQAAQEGHNVAAAMDELHREVQSRQRQLAELLEQTEQQTKQLSTLANGAYFTTGQLESEVTLQVGDKLYDKLRQAELLVKDGVVTAILG